MKYTLKNISGDAGEHLVAAKIIKLFGYPCRLFGIDIGIDAEIEIIDENLKSTGEFLKCQVKTRTDLVMHVYVDGNHIEYWNKMNIPVIIFLVHLETEQIFWHCVDDITKYRKTDSSYVIEFDAKDMLEKSNKQSFRNLSYYPTIRHIEKIYDEAFDQVTEDINIRKEEYDLMNLEDFVLHVNKIVHDFKKVDKLIRKNDVLENVKKRYLKKLEVIANYIDDVNEEKHQAILDHGDDFFQAQESENWDWDD